MAGASDSNRLGKNQTLAIGASSVATAAFGAQTYAVRLAATAPCFFEIGDNTPTASAATSPFFPGQWTEIYTVSPGQKLAVIQNATAGVMTVTEMTG